MGEQFLDAAVGERGQPPEDVLEVGVGIVAVHPGRLDQAHDGGGALAGA